MTGQLKIIQCNLNKSIQATENTLQLAMELGVEILAVQEPWVSYSKESNNYQGRQSIQHPNFYQFFPNTTDNTIRPRTMIYISKQLKAQVSHLTRFPQDTDIIGVKVAGSNYNFSLINIYNQVSQHQITSLTTVERHKSSLQIPSRCIVIGDFNEHHPDWDLFHTKSHRADDLHAWFEEKGLVLTNTIGDGTFYRPNMKVPSVIDLTLTTADMEKNIHDWQTIETGSDHQGILFTVTGQDSYFTSTQPEKLRFQTHKADWEKFEKLSTTMFRNSELFNSEKFKRLPLLTVKNLISNQTNLKTDLDKIGQEMTDVLLKAAEESIPRLKHGATQKPWWTEDLKVLRKTMMRAQRHLKADSNDPLKKERYLKARNKYFQEIKIAKKDHWNKFLENEDPSTIFKALAYTKVRQFTNLPNLQGEDGQLKESFTGKCQALKSKLFPIPPRTAPFNWAHHKEDNWKWPKLTESEVANVCCNASKGTAPGPDQMNWAIINHAYNANKEIFFEIYSIFFNIGYQPSCWREATGIILKKPGKPDYTQPKAYRVISLLNCLGKALEKIFAQRLGYLAETTHLLHISQIGGRLKKSAVDACLLLLNKIQTEKAAKRKTSTLFLDVKGAFDHVSKDRLLGIMSELRLPSSLLSWVLSFLSKRQMKLQFDRQTEKFSPIETGIPQGSPVSPILFLIYIRNMFKSSTVEFLSYIDDIALTVSSQSFKKNIEIMEREVQKLQDIGFQNAVSFDLEKTELIHFENTKAARKWKLTLPNGHIVTPKSTVRWLGVWFDQKLNFNQHVNTRVAQAKKAFGRMARLTNTEKGLSHIAMRQLYLACVISIADYASPVWWKDQKQFSDRLQGLQNIALRKILGCFKTSPIRPMEIEACLCPPEVRLNHSRRKYALRVLTLSPFHPIKKALYQELAYLDPEAEIQMRKLLQTEKIRLSLKSNIDQENIETIIPNLFPPWERKIPYEIHISNQEKEIEADIHMAKIKEMWYQNHVVYYTDASWWPDAKGVGVAFMMYDHRTLTTIHHSTSLANEYQAYNGELEAIVKALEHAVTITNSPGNVTIYSDNQGALRRILKADDRPGQAWVHRAITATTKLAQSGTRVRLEWVPAHQGIFGNEIADKLAKEAAIVEIPQATPTSINYLGQECEALRTMEWISLLDKWKIENQHSSSSYASQYEWNLQKKPCIGKGVKKSVSSAFYQLKLGHGYFKSYLKRIGKVNDDRCICGAKQTPRHLLLQCQRYKKERAILHGCNKGSQLSLSMVLHTKIGTQAALEYIEKTGICTRKWCINNKIGIG